MWFPWEGMCEAREAALGLGSLDNLHRLQDVEALSSGLVPGPGVISAGG